MTSMDEKFEREIQEIQVLNVVARAQAKFGLMKWKERKQREKKMQESVVYNINHLFLLID